MAMYEWRGKDPPEAAESDYETCLAWRSTRKTGRLLHGCHWYPQW